MKLDQRAALNKVTREGFLEEVIINKTRGLVAIEPMKLDLQGPLLVLVSNCVFVIWYLFFKEGPPKLYKIHGPAKPMSSSGWNLKSEKKLVERKPGITEVHHILRQE